MLYPLTFQPIFQERVWGGRRLEELYHKALPPGVKVGESWEVCDRPGAVSVIANGPLAGKDLRWLMENHGPELLGVVKPVNGRFPLLIKILDVQQALSLQVHPPPEAAFQLGAEPKTEMWYVAQADAGAELFAGLKLRTTRDIFEEKLKGGTVADCFHRLPIKKGDSLFLPAGRPHAAGAGTVLFEVQENSDSTYRLFDWDRVGAEGEPRDLHPEQALACIDFADWEPGLIRARVERRRGALTRTLVEQDQFAVDEYEIEPGVRIPFLASEKPLIIGVVAGKLTIDHPASGQVLELSGGQFCLLPAALEDAVVSTEQGAVCLMIEPGEGPQTAPAVEAELQREAGPAWKPYKLSRRRRPDHKPVGIPSRRRLKHMLTRQFTYWPLLKMLILKPWFRRVFSVLALLVVFLGLFLPKMWRATPRGFLPVYRISGVDKLQAFMLRRTGEQRFRAGRYGEAAYAWQMALANDPGDADLARGHIKCVLAQEPPDLKNASQALRSAFWVLRLAQTNRADVRLYIRLCEKFRLYELIYQMLLPEATRLDMPLQVAYLKALFYERRLAEFASRWRKLSADQKADPELALFGAAYLAAWGPPETATEGKQRLAAALSASPPLGIVANRLRLAVSAQVQDLGAFADSLARLEQHHVATAVDHAEYWRLLAALGRKEEAVRLAKDYAFPPSSSTEVIRLAEAQATLGLNEQALELLQRYASQFQYSERLWTTFSNLLLNAKHWDELRELALRVRRLEAVRERLEGYSYYLEGRADWESGRPEPARLAFDRAVRCRFPDASLGLEAAREMARLNQVAAARQLLLQLEKALGQDLDYWQTAFSVAYQAKDDELLLKAARNERQLRPADALFINHYAAALLVARVEAAEAVEVTRRLVQDHPTSAAAIINHSLALLLNHRTKDAETLLSVLRPSALNAEESHAYYLARFELAVAQQQPDATWQALDRIDASRLFPAQQKWLKEAKAKLPPRKTSSR
jgi:mannose-6-phosphate isomerase